MPSAKDYQTRILFDRYARKNTAADPRIGDMVIAALTRRFERDGEEIPSREIGVIVGIGGSYDGTTSYTIALTDATKPEDKWEKVRGLSRSKIELLEEKTYEEICRRVANGVIKNYPDNNKFGDAVYTAMVNEEFVPAGRILAGLGCDDLTLTFFNCYVFAPPKDSREGIAEHWKALFNTYSLGGGIGWDNSSLRPRGAIVQKVNGRSSGAVSWMEQFSQITGAVEQGGSRRGASLQGLWCWHPDIIEFIEAKAQREEFKVGDQLISKNKGLLENSNISVLISDSFMEAVERGGDWPLIFPDTEHPSYDQTWDGDIDKWIADEKPIITHNVVRARELWHKIIDRAWASGEPGLLFMERMNKMSNSYYYDKLSCTNPCGEQPLSPNSVCNLGHINLAKLVKPGVEQLPKKERTADEALEAFNDQRLLELVQTGVEFLDNITDLNYYHDKSIESKQMSERRIGLGVLGYGELLVRLGLRYGSAEAVRFTDSLFSAFCTASYMASAALAEKRGAFPRFKADKYLQSGFMKRIVRDFPSIGEVIKKHGIRNVTLNTVAPTGSVGTMLNTTTGIEPYFLPSWTARSRIGAAEEEAGILSELHQKFGDVMPSYFVTTADITPEEHVRTQATIQKWIDASISKTINLPNKATKDDVAKAYELMYKLGCKGGTVYRDGSRDRQVLYYKDEKTEKPVPLKEVPVEVVDEYKSSGFGILRPKIDTGLGVTISKDTPVGRLHATLRMHFKTGLPYDLFLVSGKGDVSADVQALGRLCSVILRWPDGEHVPQETRLEIIRDQLHRIPGRGQVGFGTDKVLSLPDGLAQVLNDYLAGNFPLSGIPMGEDQLKEFIEQVSGNKEQRQKLHDYIVNGTDDENDEDDLEAGFDEGIDSVGFDFDICPKCGNASYVHIPNKCPHCVVCMHTEC